MGHVRTQYKIYILSLENHIPSSAHNFGSSRAPLMTILAPPVNPGVIRALRQPSRGWEEEKHGLQGQRLSSVCLAHGKHSSQKKAHYTLRISHTKYKIMDSIEERDIISYLKTKEKN